MCTPSGCTYGAPFRVPHYRDVNGCPCGAPICTTLWVVHWSRERAEGEWTCDHEEKKKKSRPIMGAPLGHPYAHPEGVCINGLGALPSPYGPTLRGAHNGPSGLQKEKRLITGHINRENMCAGNLGQKPHDLGVNVRLCLHLPLPPTSLPTK